TAMVGSRSWIGGLFHRVNIRQNDKFVDYPLTPLEELEYAVFCLRGKTSTASRKAASSLR
ncbi:ELMO/CED-12 family protein, partial [Trifolium medium]|nr:ELMO/CED-12 family protein [Trifolium medium]